MVAERLDRLVSSLTDEAFERLYGPVAQLEPEDARRLMAGFDRPWWIVGGWSIQAFTRVERSHGDLDLSVLHCDVPHLVEHFRGSHDVWATAGGVMCPLLSPDQELPAWLHQVWIRSESSGSWLLDVIVAPDQDGRWVFRRDPSHVEEFEHITWEADDGLRYQNPEITLAFKVAHDQPKDRADRDATLPLLDQRARDWLRETINRLYPGHDWLDHLQPDPSRGIS